MDLIEKRVYVVNRPNVGEVEAKLIKKFKASSLMQHIDGDRKGQIFTVPDSSLIKEAGVEAPKGLPEPPPKDNPVLTSETAQEIKDNIANLGAGEPVLDNKTTAQVLEQANAALADADKQRAAAKGNKAKGKGKAKEAPAAPAAEQPAQAAAEPAPTAPLAERAASVLSEVDKLSVEAVATLAKTLPPKDNLKAKIVELLRAGHKSTDIAESLGVTTSYVGQVKIDYVDEGPKPGTKKYDVIQRHLKGEEPAAIAAALETSVGFVSQQIRLHKKRESMKDVGKAAV